MEMNILPIFQIQRCVAVLLSQFHSGHQVGHVLR